MIQNKITTTKIATKLQMATRLATQRTNFVTVTPVSAATANENNHQQQQQQQTTTTTTTTLIPASQSTGISDTIISSPGNSTAGATVATTKNSVDIDTATGALTLQQVIRQVCTKKKVLLQAGNDGQISVIDVVPIENSDSNDATPITVSLATAPDHASESSQQVTAQVAVVQADSPTDTGPHYITVTVSSPQDTVGSQGTYHLQYVDSELYTSSQGQTQMAYPVYVSDYSSSGQQYYTTTANTGNYSTGNVAANNGSSTGGANQQYIVPVDETLLTSSSRDSPQTISSDVHSYNIQTGQHQSHASTSETESPPNLSHATRVSPATVSWLMENYETAEGVSLPRSTLYNHYMRHCNEHKLDAVNAASFGKLIRSVFTGLRTRRLGTRGNSKYHYYGIRIKPGSALVNVLEDKPSTTPNHVQHQQQQQSHPRGTKRGIKLESYEACSQFLGDGAGAIPPFPTINVSLAQLPDDIGLEDVETLKQCYREHCEAFLDAVLNLEFGTVEQLWREFWRLQDNNNGDECEEEKYLSRAKLYTLCQMKGVQDFIKHIDLHFYQNMVDVLIPDVLRAIPAPLTQAIRNFAKNLELWLSSAMSGCPDEIYKIKLHSVSVFSQTLRRYTSLNHLAQAARAVLQNNAQLAQMLNDLNRVDFHNIQEQASWVCQCDTAIVQQLENDFKTALQQQNTLEQWAAWLRYVVDTALEDHRGKPSFPKAARQFLLKWSFYSSMVIRDLTLRSAATFGSFHLIRLLYDEYMFFIVEHKVAEATHTTPISVMGCANGGGPNGLSNNHLNNDHDVTSQSDSFDATPYHTNAGFEIKMEPCANNVKRNRNS
ncbi:DNA-binding protein RFX2 [Culicoides brevitarsis]|uniref:DNA-binding protein RFX2 n=1 Tax=Culicoides brevitarsis TaxID=469753 RepID=UPI00307B32DB